MKRFYATLALVGALITGANAQTMRQCDLAGFTTAPVSSADGYNLSCNTDSVLQTFFIVNNGPDNVYAVDTILVNDPRVPGLSYFYAITGDTLLAHDTMVVFNSKIAVSKIAVLTQPDADNQLQEVLRASFVSGSQYIWLNAVRLEGYSGPNVSSEDPDDSNNSGQVLINWSCTPSSIKDVNFSKTALNIFPNPASNQISFTNEFKASNTAVVKVTDIAGRTVKTINLGKQNAGTKTFNVDIAELNNGMYYIELTTDDTRSISKFTKN